MEVVEVRSTAPAAVAMGVEQYSTAMAMGHASTAAAVGTPATAAATSSVIASNRNSAGNSWQQLQQQAGNTTNAAPATTGETSLRDLEEVGRAGNRSKVPGA